jgi:hypothetical protein
MPTITSTKITIAIVASVSIITVSLSAYAPFDLPVQNPDTEA